MTLGSYSRSCRTAFIRSGIAGGLAGELAPKRLELLHELVPTANVIALLVNPTSPDITKTVSRDLEAAARILGLQLHILNASSHNHGSLTTDQIGCQCWQTFVLPFRPAILHGHITAFDIAGLI